MAHLAALAAAHTGRYILVGKGRENDGQEAITDWKGGREEQVKIVFGSQRRRRRKRSMRKEEEEEIGFPQKLPDQKEKTKSCFGKKG